MKILLSIFLLLSIPAYGQDLSSGSISGQSAQQQAAQQGAGAGYLDYISGAKRPQTKNQILTIDDFSGGLNSKANPVHLPTDQSQIAQNIRFNTSLKALTKRSPVLTYGIISGGNPILSLFRYYAYNGNKILIAQAGNQIYTGNDLTGVFTSIFTLPQPDHKSQWLTWNNQAIMTDGYNASVKYDGISSSATYLGAPLATDSGAGSSGPGTGIYTYQVSCYTNNSNNSGPFEFSFGVPSNTLAATGHTINLTMIPQCSDADFLGEPIVGRYIYRTKANGSQYYLLATIANNSAVTYTDTTADSSLSTLYPNILGATVSSPPSGLLSLIFQGRLWIANNPSFPSRVYYSEINDQEMFLPTSYYDIRANDGDQVTLMQDVLGIMTIGKNNSIQKIYTPVITGSPASDWSISDPFSFIGCISPYSAQQTPIGLLYLGNNGIYNFDGNFSTLVSDPVTPAIKDIANSNFVNAYSAFYQNQYFLGYTSSSSGATTNNRVLVYDILSKAFDIDTSNVGVFTVERGGNDIEVLYAGDSNNGSVYSYTNGTRDIINKTQADFSGTFTNAWYLPVAGGGDSQNALIELANTATIDSLTSIITGGAAISDTSGNILYDTSGNIIRDGEFSHQEEIVDLPGTIQETSDTGTYVSPPFNVNAVSFNDIYWNETLPTAGSSVTFQVRSATSDTAINSASWSSPVSNPSGSNLSNIAANSVIQYKINLSTDTLTNSPTVYSTNNYVVDLSYNISQGNAETTIPFEWKSGWLDFGVPAYKKALKKIYIEYSSAGTGTLNVTLNNWNSTGTQTNYNYGTPINFAINLTNNPTEYIEYFPNGEYDGELFNIDITESSLNPLTIKRIIFMYNVQPLI